MTKHCVWYRLADEQGGAYKRSTPAFVSISPFTTTIGQFRDAVYARNAALLAGIGPEQLVVHMEVLLNGEKKTEKVSEGKIVGRLGKTKKKALVVVTTTKTLDEAALSSTDSGHSGEETNTLEASSNVENRSNEPTPTPSSPRINQLWTSKFLEQLCCYRRK